MIKLIFPIPRDGYNKQTKKKDKKKEVKIGHSRVPVIS